MTNFSFSKNPIEGFNSHINDFEENIPKIIVKHSEGRHGSDKGCCEWCGINNPNEFCECPKETRRAKERHIDKLIELKQVYDMLEPMSKDKQKLLFKYLQF